MKNNKNKGETEVVFRKYPDGEIIALFPNEIGDTQGNCVSYMHIGQHSAADYQHVTRSTKLAAPEEYEALSAELEAAGYHLKLFNKNKKHG